ncbi:MULTISPECIES: class I SAM-dependent methyltransferase [unclassified Pseudomonas]|jgi:2-polyprenyl-3-methyl-5-hydroxy-6-metoxy-1,4-benzoquinol methylase|uniref:class I SAM-dependent methyltransferase n=1 Tax=unclassified Pseudomonas TaxID=196821 RepID=UPI000DAD544E|nr:class I SAM-dependent methyltransferase [Pseudomonas sp. URMO17WK12:I6]PZW61739.1 methyltransferase family protein [Pseudomonas sp. URMO17WK12:I6]
MNARSATTALHREQRLAQSFVRHVASPGKLDRYIEPLGPGLHQLFVLRVNGCDWVGRKVLQHTDTDGWHINSLLRPWMLLGPLAEWHWGNEGAEIYFRGVTRQEKETAFHVAQTKPDSEVCFPLPVTDDTGLEFVCPPEYWQCNESLAKQLDADESHFRQHCATLLKTISSPGAVIHDPACSTGEFIAHLARELPDRHCLGSDRSASMIEHAKNRHGTSSAEFYLADARNIASAGIKCDVLILRFLNAEVMTRADAQQTLHDMAPCVNPGGTIIVFGHTPVLISVPYMAQILKLQVISSVAARPGHTELFQFYRLKVPI